MLVSGMWTESEGKGKSLYHELVCMRFAPGIKALKLHRGPESWDACLSSFFQFQQIWNKLQSLNHEQNKKKFSKPQLFPIYTTDGDLI